MLNRSLAEAGHYPAIDIEQSISRVMHGITEATHQQLARRLKQLVSSHQRNRDLTNVGAYKRGTDPMLDEAIALQPAITALLQQGIHENNASADSLAQLAALFGG